MKNNQIFSEIEQTHVLQRAFRKTVQAFSFPGRVFDMNPECIGPDFDLPFPEGMLVLARMLLDTETSFACFHDELARVIEMLTFSHRVSLAEADFVFLEGTSSELISALTQAKTGTLLDPHEGATLIISAPFDQGNCWTLQGPGIKNSVVCDITLTPEWEICRARRNAEYPCGIDMLMVSPDNRLVAIPRTTVITKGGC
ncbi:MAG: phosphonate C-P lyase system protein PhnH [Treponemataceae bacterium]|nr:phosphonate C-P lyase system protein PhnH [Treponemataceae bacterium]